MGVFDGGQFSEELWESFDAQDKLCGMAFTNFEFMYATLCLWWCAMWAEFRRTERLLRILHFMPSTSYAASMISYHTEEEGVQYRVKGLTPLVRGMLFVL